MWISNYLGIWSATLGCFIDYRKQWFLSVEQCFLCIIYKVTIDWFKILYKFNTSIWTLSPSFVTCKNYIFYQGTGITNLPTLSREQTGDLQTDFSFIDCEKIPKVHPFNSTAWVSDLLVNGGTECLRIKNTEEFLRQKYSMHLVQHKRNAH